MPLFGCGRLFSLDFGASKTTFDTDEHKISQKNSEKFTITKKNLQ